MVQIQPVSVWKDGTVKTAGQFSLRGVADDFSGAAQIYYELREADIAEENSPVIPGSVVAVGNLTISGQDYEDWGAESGDDINDWIYVWAAAQLNIVII